MKAGLPFFSHPIKVDYSGKIDILINVNRNKDYIYNIRRSLHLKYMLDQTEIVTSYYSEFTNYITNRNNNISMYII